MGALTLLLFSLLIQGPVRTGDVTLRGLSNADFPRVTRLADNVYAYEQIDPTERTVTVNNLIVVTSAGVLIAESQGTVDHVKRLVADVARLTPRPIPAHGFVDSATVIREEERNFRLALERIIAEGTRLHGAGTALERAPAAARFEPFDGWTRAANNAFGALKRVYMELDGQLK